MTSKLNDDMPDLADRLISQAHNRDNVVLKQIAGRIEQSDDAIKHVVFDIPNEWDLNYQFEIFKQWQTMADDMDDKFVMREPAYL